MSSKYIYLLDAGHGGLINGKYVTPGKRSPIWEDGSVYYEGVGNRDIRQKLSEMLDKEGISYHFVTTGSADISLTKRVNTINSFCDMYGASKCVLISIHSNGVENPQAEGWEVYTTKGTTKSDACATISFEETQKLFPDRKFRADKKDGDVDKEANFQIILGARCRAFLTENFFHTNPHECKNILMKEEGRKKIALAHFNTILRIEKEL